MGEPTGPVYEMLWDCKYCGSKKLLGKTHRHCPSCGGAQDPSWRYFPSDAEKIAVHEHVFVGVDLVCAACGVANARSAKFCGSCGGPTEGGKDAARRSDVVAGSGESFSADSSKAARAEHGAMKAPAPLAAASPGPTSRRTRNLVLAALGIVTTLVLAAIFWKKDAVVTVVGHSWNREIQIERYGPVSDSSWCNQMPQAAYAVSRTREVRSHRQVADGQDCSTRRRDNGDGTFSESQECRTRYREEPVYDAKCHFTVDRWTLARTLTSSGASLQPPPSWPQVVLGRTGQCPGCEREGPRGATYTVVLRDQGSGKQKTCDFDETTWASLDEGAAHPVQVGVITGAVDCGALSRR